MAELTPMKRQYQEIKANYSDCLLFFRLGDFYEMFEDDAKTAARELDLALTTRDRNKPAEEQTPMCGVPYHSAEAYISRLISKGYKIAICEQMEDPAQAKGLVTRDVIRVITPGTVTESSMLDDRRSNYLAAVFLEGMAGAVGFADVSTGEFCASAYDSDALTHILNELGRFSPREAVLSPQAMENGELRSFLSGRLEASVEAGGELFARRACIDTLCSHFGVSEPEALGFSGSEDGALAAAGALLGYLVKTQKFDLSHITEIELFGDNKYMELDYTTLRNLELTQNLRTGEKKGSLLWVLDKTKTPMGARLLRSWVERPLLSPATIRRRLAAVEELFHDTVLRGELLRVLKGIGDMRRLAGRCVYGTAGGRDVKVLGEYCALLPEIKSLLAGARAQLLRDIAEMDELSDIAGLAADAIADEPPFSVREGGILRPGFNAEVDRLRQLRDHGAEMVSQLEARERERTGVKKLKVGYNRVFGYYIDVPRSAGDVPLPQEYIRKQTLTANERYFTPELKELENTLLTAGEQLNDLEFQLFSQVRTQIGAQVERIQAAADKTAALDCLCSLAETAVRGGYCCPEIDLGRQLRITEGRHPVVEAAQRDVLFVPNDTYLDDREDRAAIVTGPNMAGKSTYMRQTAIIALMAQMGSFVPAKSAQVGIIDRVFTRIGASDDLGSGQSTFMVEMSEMAAILRHATAKSLLILDEIGRGTSTYDGMAIARAVLEHCADKRKLGAKTMFATHYHELSALEGSVPGVKNYNITAKKQGGKLLFLRKIVPGAADDSYGIEVAKLAGVPDSVVSRAKACLKELESAGAAPGKVKDPDAAAPAEETQVSFTDMGADEVRDTLRSTDLNTLTPLEALNLLYRLKQKVE